MKPPVPPKPDQPFDAVCFGYNSCDILCLMERYPAPDTKFPLKKFERQGGGQAATAAVAARRLGLTVRYIGKFGDTPEGEFARQSLSEEGVDLAGSLEAAGTQNQVATIWIEETTGRRTIAYLREPGLEITPAEIDRRTLTAGRILLVDGHNLPAVIQAARWAREEGIPVAADIERHREGTGELLDHTDYILCDKKFPALYTGLEKPEDALRAIRDRHRAPFVSMTLGAQGSLALAENQWIRTPAFDVPIVDTTGAGDVWHGAFVAGLIWGWELEESLRLAGAAAAIKCRRLGGRAGIGDGREVLDFLRAAPARPGVD